MIRFDNVTSVTNVFSALIKVYTQKCVPRGMVSRCKFIVKQSIFAHLREAVIPAFISINYNIIDNGIALVNIIIIVVTLHYIIN